MLCSWNFHDGWDNERGILRLIWEFLQEYWNCFIWILECLVRLTWVFDYLLVWIESNKNKKHVALCRAFMVKSKASYGSLIESTPALCSVLGRQREINHPRLYLHVVRVIMVTCAMFQPILFISSCQWDIDSSFYDILTNLKDVFAKIPCIQLFVGFFPIL